MSATAVETRSFGEEDQLTAEQMKEQIAQNPELTPDDRQQMLIISRSSPGQQSARGHLLDATTGQQSTHRYPFNAKDYLALMSTQGAEKGQPAKKAQKVSAARRGDLLCVSAGWRSFGGIRVPTFLFDSAVVPAKRRSSLLRFTLQNVDESHGRKLANGRPVGTRTPDLADPVGPL